MYHTSRTMDPGRRKVN